MNIMHLLLYCYDVEVVGMYISSQVDGENLYQIIHSIYFIICIET